MSAHYASPADWERASMLIEGQCRGAEILIADGKDTEGKFTGYRDELRRVLASIAAMSLCNPPPAPSRFAGKHGDMASLVVGGSVMDEDREYEARETRADAREERAAQRCRCGDDMPGHCPGPANCPMCDDDDEEEA